MNDRQGWDSILAEQFAAIADDVESVADESDDQDTTEELREIAADVREVGASWAGRTGDADTEEDDPA